MTKKQELAKFLDNRISYHILRDSLQKCSVTLSEFSKDKKALSDEQLFSVVAISDNMSKQFAALNNELAAIYCIGETLEERKSGAYMDVILKQCEEGLAGFIADDMDNIILAYEPVWAIGTGETASPEQAQEVHAGIRAWLTERFEAETAQDVSILYGGSCKPGNAAELFAKADIDGGLIGGASLNAADFTAIIEARTKA